ARIARGNLAIYQKIAQEADFSLRTISLRPGGSLSWQADHRPGRPATRQRRLLRSRMDQRREPPAGLDRFHCRRHRALPQDPPARRSRPASARTRIKTRLPVSNRVSALPLFSTVAIQQLRLLSSNLPRGDVSPISRCRRHRFVSLVLDAPSHQLFSVRASATSATCRILKAAGLLAGAPILLNLR